MESKQTLLIVDDKDINRKILCKILAGKYNIIEAENGEVGWDLLNKNKSEIDGVLLDIYMPVLDGYGFLEKVRRASMTELPIIVMTAHLDVKTEKKALSCGAWDFVGKPYDSDVLLARLTNAMARRQVSVYRKMQKMSAHDSLTGLHNRSRTFQKIREMIDANPNERFAFVRIDVDNFALYNSAFGEEEGDKLLCYVANAIYERAKATEKCLCGRITADVFCMCFPYDDNKDKLGKIVDEMQQNLANFKKNYLIEISAGVYVIDEPQLSVEKFYIRASMGAQKCKSQYGRHLGFYDEAFGKRVEEENSIISEMERAIENREFVVYLQPKVDLTCDCVSGAEALVRWIHPKKGLISPAAFIPVFERNGFIAKLDYYVWEETCRIIRSWMDKGIKPNPVSVNISRISLYNPQIVQLLVDLVNKYEIGFDKLQLEITESAYMTNPDLMKNTISNLHKAGFIILMDDFGSSYSSLNTLKDIDVDVLKVDMKFLTVTEHVGKGEIILASIIKMANWIGLEVVCEGVETKMQRDFLLGTGCDFVQGYFYAKPMPVADYEQKYLFSDYEQKIARKKLLEKTTPDTNATVLVVDDNESDRYLLKSYLEDKYYVVCVENAEEALAYMKRNQKSVKLILIDNIMPHMSGMDFLLLCQNSDIYSSIPQIMITAENSTVEQVKAFKNGAFDYITKPLVREIIEARIEHCLKLGRQYNVDNQE